MSADDIVRGFLNVIVSCWDAVSRLLVAKDRSVLNDWLQANWEILVEANVCHRQSEYLEVYGEGADCNGASSRVWQPSAQPTHAIACVIGQNVRDVLGGRILETGRYRFDRFVSWNGSVYSEAPPFDFVFLEEGDSELIVAIENVSFAVEEI